MERLEYLENMMSLEGWIQLEIPYMARPISIMEVSEGSLVSPSSFSLSLTQAEPPTALLMLIIFIIQADLICLLPECA